jgi:DNA-binding response OmpR family regulator
MQILIIEDNPDILANLYDYLEPLGHTLDSARNGFAGLARAAEGDYDAIVLDLMLPGMDGLDVCKKLRKELRRETPVLMLTARDTLQDKVAGLECGADDYLVKPFSLIELDARLKALVRRATNAHLETVMKFGPLCLDAAMFEVTRGGRRVELTPTGYKLLRALIRVAPRVLSREALEREVWGDDPPDSESLRTHIHTLRQVLDKSFASPMLKTVQNVGYRLVDPDAQ